jgi:hypothetical protein
MHLNPSSNDNQPPRFFWTISILPNTNLRRDPASYNSKCHIPVLQNGKQISFQTMASALPREWLAYCLTSYSMPQSVMTSGSCGLPAACYPKSRAGSPTVWAARACYGDAAVQVQWNATSAIMNLPSCPVSWIILMLSYRPALPTVTARLQGEAGMCQSL